MPPSCIGNVLAELGVADQVLDLKGFDADRLVLVNQSTGQFMEVVHPAIGDLGVNTSHFAFGLGPVLRTEDFSSQSPLVSGQLSRIFSRMPWIAGFFSPVGHEQVLDAQINAKGVWRDTQHRRGEFAQARDKVSSRRILGQRQSTGRRGKLPRPTNIQRILTLCDIELSFPIAESPLGQLRRLAVAFPLEGRVLCPSLPEIDQGPLLMAKTLLQRHRGDLIEVGKFRKAFDFRQPGAGLEVIDLFLSFLIGQASPFQNQVIDFAHAAKGLSQENLLLGCGVKPIFVGPFARIHDKGYSLC